MHADAKSVIRVVEMQSKQHNVEGGKTPHMIFKHFSALCDESVSLQR